jgi:hypothetical protein
MIRTSPILLALLLAGGYALAQNQPSAPGINRNPAYRELLPPNPVPAPDVRDTVVPNPGPGDPRDSDSRPVLPPTATDGRETVIPGSASTGPTNPVAPATPVTRP